MKSRHGLAPGRSSARDGSASWVVGACAAALSLAAAGSLSPRAARAAAAGPHGAAASAQAPTSGVAATAAQPIAVVRDNATPALVEAAKDRQVEAALDLIKRGANANAAAPDGTTALLWAVHFDEVPLIDRLLAAHANVRAGNDYGATPMSEAAVYGDTAVIKKLVRAGADADSPNADGQTALMILARTDNVEAARFLIRHGAHVNAKENLLGQTALHWAAARSEPKMVKLLLHYHANPNVRSNFNTFRRQITAEPRIQARPTGGLTPLIYAARQGCIECAQYLVAGGADINMTDPDGETPLLIATENFHFDLAAYLLKKGANPNQWDWWGRTPLYAAVDLNTLPYGGRPDHISLDNTTSLKMIQLLLDAGANPNAQLKLFPPYRSLGADRGGDGMLTTGTTPLLRAAKAGDTAAMRLLLAHGANPSLPNRYGDTPLMAAAGLGTTDVDTRGKYKTQKEAVESIDLLVAAGAKVNTADWRGDTALIGAASWGWNDVVRCLVSHHADLNARDSQGKTAIDAALGQAVRHGRGTPVIHQDTANLLRQLMVASNTPGPNPKNRAL